MIYIYRPHQIDTFRLISYANNIYILDGTIPKFVTAWLFCIPNSYRLWLSYDQDSHFSFQKKSDSLWYRLRRSNFQVSLFPSLQKFGHIERRDFRIPLRTPFWMRKSEFCWNYTEYGLVTVVTMNYRLMVKPWNLN